MNWNPFWTGVRIAAVLSLLLAVGLVMSGGRSIEHLGRPWYVVLAMNWVFATLIGLGAGLLSPWATTRLRACLVGVLLATPAAYLLYAVYRPHFSPQVKLIATIISGLLYGVTYGALLWKPEESGER